MNVGRYIRGEDRHVGTARITAEKPGCAVGGLVRPGAVCGSVIVGGKLCGYVGKCEHQRAPSTTQPPDSPALSS